MSKFTMNRTGKVASLTRWPNKGSYAPHERPTFVVKIRRKRAC